MTILEGNIFDQKKGIILEQVNCQGVHASGLAAQMNKIYPQVQEQYKIYCLSCQSFKKNPLGSVKFVEVSNDLKVACCFGQFYYGTKERNTNYGALSYCLNIIKQIVQYTHEEVHVPWLMGCGLGGGSWDIVSEMIDFYLPNAKIWKLPPLGVMSKDYKKFEESLNAPSARVTGC